MQILHNPRVCRGSLGGRRCYAATQDMIPTAEPLRGAERATRRPVPIAIRLLVNPTDLPEGTYDAWVRLQALALCSGRVSVHMAGHRTNCTWNDVDWPAA